MTPQERYLRAFLEMYWLRPETALWRALDCLALDEVGMSGPVLDLGCGDGLFTFTRAGGRMAPDFDAFSQVGDLDAFFDKVDIYNFSDANTRPDVRTPPAWTVDVGLDHKDALLRKAFSTGLYREVVEADANADLPLEDGRFGTVYSNILYWLDNYPLTLREIRRVLRDDGRVLLQVPSETFRDYSFYQRLYVQGGDPRWQWLHLIDRGRSDNIRHCKTFDAWRDDFAAVGLKVAHHRRYLSKTVLEAWDIGLRPISPFLIEMANKLAPENRAAIKAKWIEGILPLLLPLCELDWITDAAHPPGFHLFVLEKGA